MDTIDRPDSNLPARLPADSSRAPAPLPAIARDLAPAPTPPSNVSPQVILRGLSRHWRRILLISLALYAPLAYAIWTIIEPTYEAVSVLRVQPAQPEPYGPSGLGHGMGELGSISSYLQTQVELVKSDSVLDNAITNPAVTNFPLIKDS